LTILVIGLISTYTGYTIGQFKCRHVQIHSMADAGDILVGRIGRTTLDIAQLVFFVLVMGSHILTFSIMMNVLTEHSSCTIIFSVVGLLVSFLLTLPRRLERLSHISSVSFVSITGAVLTGMVGVALAKQGPTHVPAFSPTPKLHGACLAIANIIFAHAGHVAFFTLFSELKELKNFPKALALLQMSEMVLYTIAATVIYAYVGPDVNSPALNSARELFRKISYAIAIPTVRIHVWTWGHRTDILLDCDWRCGQRPCRCEIRLCSCFPGHQLHAQRVFHSTSSLGCDLCGALDFVVDHCRGYSGIQRCAGACGVYYMFDSFEVTGN
jgi:hypothetical protein